MFTLSVFDATGAVTRLASFTPFVAPTLYSLRCQSEWPFKGDSRNRDDESIGRSYQSIPRYWLRPLLYAAINAGISRTTSVNLPELIS
jgi:hypothetical protein